jgi:hypothetical protein
MNIRGLRAGLTILLLAATAGLSVDLDFRQHQAVQESLSRVPARFRAEWLDRRGLKLPPWNAPLPTTGRDDSLGLRLVGKYGRGPSNEVTGQGDLLALTLGSEVALLSFANPDSPVVLSEIQFDLIPRQSALFGSYLVTCDDGIEFWDIINPRAPVYRSSIPYTVGDFAIADTFLFFVHDDTFHAYSIANPSSPCQLGSCVDGGYVMAATRNVAVVREPGDVMGFIDVSDPAAPRRVGTYPSYALSADARGNICCASIYWSTDDDHFRLEILDISDPANVRQIGAIDSVGGWDVQLSGPLAFVSGFQTSEYEFTIASLQDSTDPQVVSSCATPSKNYGVWADWTSDRAFVADMTGLAVIDISNLNTPVLDTALLQADLAYDVAVDSARAYVADFGGGVKVLDVADPTRPRELGGRDSILSYSRCVVARDSFAFASWQPGPYFRSYLVSDPAHPVQVGSCPVVTIPEAMVLRDSLVYLAGRLRFQVVNVARPRQPVMVGTCNLSGDVGDMCVVDSLAYVTSLSFTTINVARPDSPNVVNLWSARASGVDVVDTIAYMAYYGLKTASIANPTSPYIIDTVFINDFTQCVVVVDTLAYLGGNTLRIFNVADPSHIFQVGSWQPPDWVYKLRYAPPYVYAACWGAGVCILDTVTTGISEERSAAVTPVEVGLRGSLVKNELFLDLPGANGKEVMLSTYDMTGRCVDACVQRAQGQAVRYSFARLPAGVYVLRARTSGRTQTFKVVKL